MKIQSVLVALLLLLSRATHAQLATVNGTSVRQLRDLPYVTNGADRQKLDLYLPAETGAPRPLAIWIHGGGWSAGSKDGCRTMKLLAHGYAAASIGYRLSQQALFPAQIEDCKAAIRYLRAHSKEYGIDPARIAVVGESAGGHLAALLGTTGDIRDFDVGENLDQPSSVQCVIEWFGPMDFLHWDDVPDKRLDVASSPVARLLGGTVGTHEDLARRASPVNYINAHTAPFFIMHGDRDTAVPVQQARELNELLQKAGVESTLKILPGAGHGGTVFGSLENLLLMTEFLDRHLQTGAVAK